MKINRKIKVDFEIHVGKDAEEGLRYLSHKEIIEWIKEYFDYDDDYAPRKIHVKNIKIRRKNV